MSTYTKFNSVLDSRLKNQEDIKRASRNIDHIREKFGKPEKGFNSLNLLRKLRDSR